jgi:hypothetical protein
MIRTVLWFRHGVFARRIISRPNFDFIPAPRRSPLTLLMHSCRIWYAQSILAQIITILFADRKQGEVGHGHPLEQPATLTSEQPVTLKFQLAERTIQQSKTRGNVWRLIEFQPCHSNPLHRDDRLSLDSIVPLRELCAVAVSIALAQV